MIVDETERALRAATCTYCNRNIPLVKGHLHHAKEWSEGSHARCTYNPKLLTLFNSGVAGAYAAAAKQCESDAAGARELIASNTGTKLGNQIAETVAATAEELAKRIRALTPADAQQASPFTNQRLFDLVRHQRSELHVAELITDDEYALLAQEHSAVKRLEDYDAAIASAEARAQILLKGLKKIHNLTGETKTEDYAAGVIADYEAAARTSDSIKEPG